MQKLRIVTTEANTKASDKYAAQIFKIWETDYKEKIDLKVVRCDNINQAEEYISENKDCKFLFLDPCSFNKSDIKHFTLEIDAEKNQVSNVISDSIISNYSNKKTKILILGTGNVAVNVFFPIAIANKFFTTICGSQYELISEDLEPYDIIVNCTSENAYIKFAFKDGVIFDAAGNWQNDVKIVDNIKQEWLNNIVTIGEIGKATVRKMLEDVMKGGK